MLRLTRQFLSRLGQPLRRKSGSKPIAYGWRVTIFPVLLCSFAIAQAVWLPLHSLNCPYNFNHTETVVAFTARSFESVSRLKSDYRWERPNPWDQWVKWSSIGAVTDFTPDTAFSFDQLASRPLGRTSWAWAQALGVMIIRLYPADVLTANGAVMEDSLSRWNDSDCPQLWVRCRPSWSAEKNRASMLFLTKSVEDHLRPWVAAPADSVNRRTTVFVEYHGQHLLQWPLDRLRLLLGLIFLPIIVAGHFIMVRNNRAAFSRLHAEHRGRERDYPRMPLWRLFFAWDLQRSWRNYQKLLEDFRRRDRVDRKQRQSRVYEDHICEDLALNVIPAFEQQLNGQEVPLALRRFWRILHDSEVDLEQRFEALRRLEHWLRFSRTSPAGSANLPADERPELVVRAQASRRRARGDQRVAAETAWQHFEKIKDNPRRSLGDYWLQRVIDLSLPPKPANESVAVLTATPAETVAVESSPRRLEDFVQRLVLDDLVPNGIDARHVHAVLVWGLLRPGQRGRTMVKARYRTVQYVQSDVRSKLGANFNPEAYEAACSFLKRTGVIMSDHKRKRHQPIMALNPHVNEASGVGQEIVRRVLRFKDELTALAVL